LISAQEIDRRLGAFRAGTEGHGRVVHGRANVRYLTGYDGGGFTPWLAIGDDWIVLVHYSADEDSVAGLDVPGLEPVGFEPEDDHLTALRAALGRFDGRPLQADLDWWMAPDVAGLPSDVGDCSALLNELRAVKSAWEQDALRRAGSITSAVMDRLEREAEGRTARELAAILYAEAIERGSGPFTSIPYLAVGQATFENHATWDWHERAEASEEACGAYLFEFATSVEGYGVPLSRSRCDDADGQRALVAIEDGVRGIREALVPGAHPRALHAIMHESISAAGFRFAHRAGYSIGLGDLETWMEGSVARLGPREGRVIRSGMSFHIVGSVVAPGRFGVARSNSVLVTDSGAEVLSA
jgi:Xaa-Pro aminopeptidase